MKLRPNEIFLAALGATVGAGADHILSNAQPMKQLIMAGDTFGVVAAAVIVSAGVVGGAYKLGDIIEKKFKPKSDFSHNR